MAVYQYYTDADTTREDLTDLVTMISPTDTPFLSMTQTGRDARSRVHQWTTDALAARSAGGGQIEGFTFSSDTLTGRTRLTNYTQINARQISVSDSARAMDNVGTRDEFAHQTMKAIKELGTHIEFAMWSTATAVSGTSGAAAISKAILPWITTNASTSGATRTLTLILMNAVLQSCWAQGGNPDYIYCGGTRKVALSAMISTAYGQRQVPAGTSGGTIYQYVDVYMGDFGTQTVHLQRDIAVDTYAIIEGSKWAVSWLTGRHPKMIPIGRNGDRTDAMLVGEWTLEARAENANGKLEEIG
jgi:hypothetical protein